MAGTSIRVTCPSGGVPVVEGGSLCRIRAVTVTSPDGGGGTSGSDSAVGPSGTQPRTTSSAGPASVTNGVRT